MKPLTVYLLPLNENRFKVIVDSPTGEASIESGLPFFDGQADRRFTVLRALEATAFRSSAFAKEGEQDWMVQAGLLTEDQQYYHPHMHVNIGQALYRALFAPGKKAEALLRSSRDLAQAHSGIRRPLHIQLQFDAQDAHDARLPDYPWELAHDGQGFLAAYGVTFSRYIRGQALRPNVRPFEKINVLLISSSAFDEPNGLRQLPQDEQDGVVQGLEKAAQAGHIRLAQLTPATFPALRQYLTQQRDNDAPYVIHFDGHGFFGKRCNNTPSTAQPCRTMHHGLVAKKCQQCGADLPDAEGFLVFDDGAGKAEYVSAQELGACLGLADLHGGGPRQHQGIVLVVLSACQSALALGERSVYNGVAQRLISHGISAVVAMQFQVSVDGAARFAEQLYRTLGERVSLAMAVTAGREAMGIADHQWYRPVLYVRWQDDEGGQLLAAPQEVIKDGLKGLEELMGTPEVLIEVLHSQKDLRRARTQINILGAYKDLHDRLHDLQLLCYDSILQEARRFTTDEMALENLRNHESTLQRIISQCQEIVDRGFLPTHETRSITEELDQAQKKLHAALENSDTKRLREAVSLLNRLLFCWPASINVRLIDSARVLRLPDFVTTMTSIVSKIDHNLYPTKELDRFKAGIDDLDILNKRLSSLIELHDAWQRAEVELRRIENSMTQSTEELEVSWSMLKVLIAPLYSASQDKWAKDLQATGDTLEMAIAVQDPLMQQHFRSFRRQARNRFFQVDIDLKKLCDELRDATAPLDSSSLRMIV